jgi:hypothetical protein
VIRLPARQQRRPLHSTAAILILVVLGVGELMAARHDRVVPVQGMGCLARIDPGSPEPEMWRWAPGIGPVLARRLADAAAAGLIQAPTDLERVSGIGPILAGRLRGCVHWGPPL